MSGNSPANVERRTGSARWSGSSRSGNRLPPAGSGGTTRPPLARSGDRQGEVALRVGVPGLETKPGLLEHGLGGGAAELVGVLRPDAFFRRDADGQPQAA